MRRLVILVSFVVLTTAPRGAAQSPLDWAGCYVLEMGWWSPAPTPSNVPYITPPARIQLDTVAIVSRAERATMRLMPFQNVDSSGDATAYWKSLPHDSALLAWSTGFSGVRLRVQRTADGFDGVAEGWIDVPPPRGAGWPRAAVRGTRVPCSR